MMRSKPKIKWLIANIIKTKNTWFIPHNWSSLDMVAGDFNNGLDYVISECRDNTIKITAWVMYITPFGLEYKPTQFIRYTKDKRLLKELRCFVIDKTSKFVKDNSDDLTKVRKV